MYLRQCCDKVASRSVQIWGNVKETLAQATNCCNCYQFGHPYSKTKLPIYNLIQTEEPP